MYLLINNYDYYIFTQDTFILKNNSIYACYINEHDEQSYFYYNITEYVYKILKQINLFDHLDKITFCWCVDFYNYIKDINMINKFESECFEKYAARILYELNNHKNYNIDGFININILSYFEKKYQNKTEQTIEILLEKMIILKKLFTKFKIKIFFKKCK